MKLLIIEDSERLRRSLTKGFSELGFAVDNTGDGKEGLSFARNFDYDVIVLDIMLPSMDGFSILKKLRDSKILTNVIILSARDQIEERIKGLNTGADDYLCKPFSFDELHARVLTLVRRSHSFKTNAIGCGELSINIQLKRVSISDVEVSLTPLEYSIVEQLALNIDRVLSFEQLLNHLYNSDIETSRNAVEVHISSVRKKFKAAGLDNVIETRRGFGYVIRKTCLKAQ